MLKEKEICKTNNWLDKNGFTKEEEAKMYEEQLREVFFNPRHFLDNLDTFQEYRVSWHRYREDRGTLPYKLTKKQKTL